MFENHLFLMPVSQDHGVFIKALDPADQFDSVDQIDRYLGFFLTGIVEESILHVEGFSLHQFHRFLLFVVIPVSFPLVLF